MATGTNRSGPGMPASLLALALIWLLAVDGAVLSDRLGSGSDSPPSAMSAGNATVVLSLP